MHDSLMEAMWSTGHLSGVNAEYVEELYERYLSNPESVPSQWQEFFANLPSASGNGDRDISHAEIQKDFRALGK
ncbi:MAG: hypothetical protein MI746_00835, partial [Pseudomonadales bacterium]|nr:hypothetical protein [Pseudomonadales bacterium]